MTEDEAKTKWCPYATFTGKDSDAAGNRNAFTDSGLGRCIASECMAWRWQIGKIAEGPFDESVEGPTDQGYCGLAGSP